jgi:hypothetical protein
MLELRTGDWVPERFVVVGNPSVVSRRDAKSAEKSLNQKDHNHERHESHENGSAKSEKEIVNG